MAGLESIFVSVSVRCENANIVLLHFQVRGIARHVHVHARSRQQHGLFHHPQRLARREDLALGRAHFVGRLLAVKERLRPGQSDRMGRGQTFRLE